MPPVILPDSNVFIGDLRAGLDPFERFAPYAGDCEFATCGPGGRWCQAFEERHQITGIGQGRIGNARGGGAGGNILRRLRCECKGECNPRCDNCGCHKP